MAAAGDKFLKQFLRNEDDLKAFIGSLVLDPHARDDVFQDVAVTLWQRIDDYDPGRSFGAWARGIAARKILKARDQNQRFPVVFAPETIQAIADAFDRSEAAAAPRLDALRECLKQLPERSRSLLEMRYERSLTVGDIAENLSCSVDSAYQTLSRVRARLEDCIRARLGQPRWGG